MAAATTVVNDQLVTSTATEVQYELTRPYDHPQQWVRVELVSGSVQWGVHENETVFTPRISSETTYSTAGDKAMLLVENGKFNLRAKGVATWRITW